MCMAQTVLSNATAAHIRLEPFPHLVIENVLPLEDYAALEATFPSLDVITGSLNPRTLPSNRRYSMPAWPLLLRGDLPAPWRHFLEQHTSRDFLAEVFSKLAGYWDERVVARMTAAVSAGNTGLLHRDSGNAGRVVLDARVEINSPVTGQPSSARGAHLDTPNRLYSGLFYLRSEDDDAQGGELELYRWVDEPAGNIDVLELPVHLVRKVAAIPYRANQLVLFPQSINALHGVGIRYPTQHVRRYVFITAEIEEDWLAGDGSSAKSVEAMA